MTFGRTLTKIALAGTLFLGESGCNATPEYHFNGKIGEEQIKFYESGWTRANVLVVRKTDGSEVRYEDFGKDFKLDCVEITVGDNTTEYNSDSKNPAVLDVIKKAQKQFDDYLTKITEVQTAPLDKE